MTVPLLVVPARADVLVPALRAAVVDGTGPAVAPHPTCATATADPEPVLEGVALVLRTSGSTGEPHEVLLTATALRASASATHARLGGPGHWLLALPAAHVAGAQVIVRSLLGGLDPDGPTVLAPGPFRPDGFVRAVAGMGHDAPRYTSLVPTQLARVLDDAAATAALSTFDAVLVGGAHTPRDLLVRARAAGARVVTTYGMTETCGGCVYDGVPLDGVSVRIEADATPGHAGAGAPTGRVLLGGPVLALGYRGRPDLDAEAFVEVPDGSVGTAAGPLAVRGSGSSGSVGGPGSGARWLRTQDVGTWAGGALTVLGRTDDMIVTGGVKVAPAAVEEVLAGAPGVGRVCVVGVPDPQWGQAVTAVVVAGPGHDPAPAASEEVGAPGAAVPGTPRLEELRARVTARLGVAWAPRHLVVVAGLPERGPGKIDRRAVVALATAEVSVR